MKKHKIKFDWKKFKKDNPDLYKRVFLEGLKARIEMMMARKSALWFWEVT